MNQAVAAKDGPSATSTQCKISCTCIISPRMCPNFLILNKCKATRKNESGLIVFDIPPIENCGEPQRLPSRDGRAEWTGRMSVLRIAALVLTVAVVQGAAFQALACSFDTDCSPGSKCVKPTGRVVGICSGGQFPGNQYDKTPYSDPFDPNRTAGKTCSFNIECGPGNHCQMGSGTYGVCVRP